MEKRDLIFRLAALALLAIVAVQLAAIWWELHAINREQLKSFYAVIPEEAKREVNEEAKKRAQGTLYSVQSSIRVEVENQPLEVQVTH